MYTEYVHLMCILHYQNPASVKTRWSKGLGLLLVFLLHLPFLPGSVHQSCWTICTEAVMFEAYRTDAVSHKLSAL